MKKITDKISETTNFPLETISSAPKIEITDNSKIYIENHKGIKLLSTDIVIIKLNKGFFVLEGEKIAIQEINKEYIYLTGIFNSFKFNKNLE